MAVREILLLGNPILRTECERVVDFSGISRTIEDLRDTLADFRRRNGFGRGIAAPQIGTLRRIVFTDVGSPMTLVNPRIVRRSRQLMTLWDDCFSFPDILVKVKRALRISVAYQDESGRRRSLSASNGLSELLQHEIDHLDGVLAIDRAVSLREIVLRSEWKKISSRSSVAL